ncbi:type IV secretory system conjugative DNA transfer family protein [Ahrensia sp. 13_GOM-1096m]|uniref:type IV secretory system conjugative DNA transfer family protein n=1 Tax=Ahrensia sp. 13_GOM-1096m TaxID=1380380 RepID=UPI000687F04C|nr:type IV secretory system conjugative DNA transfer family protein [Ahrensia sp. 13_GOM-1096m]
MTDTHDRALAVTDPMAAAFKTADPRFIFFATIITTVIFFNITDGAFLGDVIMWRSQYYVDTTPYRIGLVVQSALLGFVIGWFLSGEHQRLRALMGGAIAGVLVFLLIFDHGTLGWGSATLLSIIAFVSAFGYWTRGFVEKLRETPTTFGSAAWARFREILAAGFIGVSGFRLGFIRDEFGGLQALNYNSDRHMATFAPTRAQKGVSMIIPNLLTYEGSVVVTDIKGENAMITAKRRKEMGQDVHVIDPWNITSLSSSRFNPMDWLVKGDVDISENAMLLADAIIVSMGDNEQFWTEEAKALLLGVILFVATDESEDGQRHLGRVRDLLLLDGDDLMTLFKRMLQSPHHTVRATGARCLQKEEKLLSNVLASVQAQTHFLDSPRLRDNLMTSDFNFMDVKSKPMSIYLVLPADRLNAYGRWLRLLIQQGLTVMARDIENKPEKSVLFILDEMPALGKLTMIEQAFGLMAGFGLQLHAICQDASQLKRIYGDGWETFISNAGVIQYFGSRDNFTADYFSKLCGKTTVWSFSTAVARAFGITRGKDTSQSETTTTTDTATGTQRQLAYADELMRMPKDQQLLFIENLNPIMARKMPWFENDELKHLGVNLHAKGNAEPETQNEA